MDIVNSSYNNIMVVWFVFLSLSVLSGKYFITNKLNETFSIIINISSCYF